MRRLKKEKGFFEEGVINETAMLAYLNHELNTEEQQQFEKLLRADPFAQEALEGLQNAQSKVAVPMSISTINKKVRERAGLKEKGTLDIHWTNYAWAAVLVGLLIGIGFVMVNYTGKSGQEIAMKQDEGKKSADEIIPAEQKLEAIPEQVQVSTGAGSPEIAKDGKAAVSRFSDSINSNLLSSNNPGLKDNKQGKQSDDIVLLNTKGKQGTYAFTTTSATGTSSAMNSTLVAGDGNPPTAAAPAAGGAGNDANRNQIITVQDQSTNVSRQEMVTENVSAFKTESKENKNAKVPATKGVVRGSIMEKEESDRTTIITLNDAMNSFNSGDYKKSSGQFDLLLGKQPGNADALYYGGISDYIIGNTKKSEKNFDKLLKEGTKFVDGSKWYKANILLMKGKRDEAKKLLDDLSQSSGSYKERALKRKADVGF